MTRRRSVLASAHFCAIARFAMSENRDDDIKALYERAFRGFGSAALWNMRPVKKPTPADALAITQALRTHGRMDGRRLAERIEELCRAHQ